MNAKSIGKGFVIGLVVLALLNIVLDPLTLGVLGATIFGRALFAGVIVGGVTGITAAVGGLMGGP